MGVLKQLRTQIQQRLQAVAYFADITILTEDKGDIENEIARALGAVTAAGGKLGICAVVMTAAGSVRNPNLPGPYLEAITVAVHVEENVLINNAVAGTSKPASDVAEQVLAALHRWTPTGFVRPLIAQPNTVRVVEPAIGDIAYACVLAVANGIPVVTLSTVATPVADPADGEVPQTVELTCATAGAAIFYTTDGSLPSPVNGTLYTVPVAVTEAGSLKARAFLAGYLDSVLMTATYTPWA